MDAIGSIFALLIVATAGLTGLLLFGFWVWALVDAITNEPSEGNDKLIWVLVIIFTGFIGALIYFFLRRPQRLDRYRK